ncbi:MAG: hypothetical protein AAGI52_14055 [Bacteroidota bacterium]
MGLDIHFIVERRRADGAWERVEPLGPPDDPSSDFPLVDGTQRINLYWTRSYATFSALADVRNRSRDIPPIHPPRGVPSDMSAETRAVWDWWREEDTEAEANDWLAASWLTLREMLDYDWPKRFTRGPEGDREILGVLEQMKQFGPPDEVRAVFWFD